MKTLLLAATLLSTTALSQTVIIPENILTLDASRTVLINGVIGRSAVSTADKILAMRGKRPINIVINSSGGSVFTGNTILQAIATVQAKGTRVNCVVTRFAASMAFIIFNECNNRYALPNSLLLWHAPRISYMGLLTPDILKPMYDQLAALKKFFDQRILMRLKIKPSLYEYYSKNDFVHFGQDLYNMDRNYLTLISGVVMKRGKRHGKK